MNHDANPLLDAVDALTRPRSVHTTQECDVRDCTQHQVHMEAFGPIPRRGVHTEQHPPLLTLLAEGTGISKGSPNSNIRIPIDADALEIQTQIRELIQLWCRQLDASYVPDDLPASIRHWYLAHANALRSGKLGEGTDHDVTRMVEGWVRMIEKKFDPDEKREWVDPCPARIPTLNIDGDEIGYRRCAARRIVVAGEERFAIQLNVTTMTAECARCRTRWEGERAILTLRYETALYNLERAETDAARDEALADLARLSRKDTPEAQSA